jgi:hypothetical protein
VLGLRWIFLLAAMKPMLGMDGNSTIRQQGFQSGGGEVRLDCRAED